MMNETKTMIINKTIRSSNQNKSSVVTEQEMRVKLVMTEILSHETDAHTVVKLKSCASDQTVRVDELES